MKRVISLILVLAMLTGVMPVRAAAEEQPETQQTVSQEETTGQTVSQEETTEQTVSQQETTEETAARTQPEETASDERTWEDFRYTLLADGSACICGFDGTPEKKDEPFLLEVPESIQGAAVTEISEGAFAGNDAINALLLPKTLKTVGSGALEGCENLKVIAFCGEEPSFGESLAKDCDSLEEIFLLKDRDFSALTALLEKDLGEEASRKAEYRSFENADALEAAFDALAVVPEPAPSDEAADTPESQDPVLQDSITAASTLANGTCGAYLTWVLDSNGTLTISGTGKMDDFDTLPLWYDQREHVQNVEIASGVTGIGACAFAYCNQMVSVSIPDSVTEIGEYAFDYCKSLKKIEIPNSVTSIGGWCFYHCDSLTDVTLPNQITSIEEAAFRSCGSLTSLEIPEGVTSIGKYAFMHGTSLAAITIPDGVTDIGADAFYSCTSLTSATIPDSVTSVGESAFDNCDQLTDVYYSGTEEQWGQIAIGAYNDPLTNATIHYNSQAEEAVPAVEASFDGHKYALYDLSMTWTEAKEYCQKLGGHLVTITSAEEQAFINSILPSGSMNLYWNGLAEPEENNWQWVTGEPVDYLNWASGEPNNQFSGTESFCQIYCREYASGRIGQWNDACDDGGTDEFYRLSHIGFICEYDSSDVSSDWRQAYYDYIVQNRQESDTGNWDYVSYELVYLDGDDIPEIYITYESWAAGCNLLSFHNGQVIHTILGSGQLTYVEKENVFLHSYGHMGSFWDTIYTLTNGVPTEVVSGTATMAMDENGYPVEGNTTYTWEGETVSEQEYQNKINEYIDPYRAKPTGSEQSEVYDYDGILAYLLSGSENDTPPEISEPISSADLLAFSNLAYEDWIVGETIYDRYKNQWDQAVSGSVAKEGLTNRMLYGNVGNWKVIATSKSWGGAKSAGFYAVTFQGKTTEGIQTVIAYRGSEGLNKILSSKDAQSDWLVNDLPFHTTHVYTPQLQEARDYYLYCANTLGIPVTMVTGHSLGGALAQVVTMAYGVRGETFNAASAFEALYFCDSFSVGSSFRGIDKWNILAHVISTDLLVGAYLGKYETMPYTVYLRDKDGQDYVPLVSHNLSSFIHNENGKIGFAQVKKHSDGSTDPYINLFQGTGNLDGIALGTSQNDKIYNTKLTLLQTMYGGDGDDVIISFGSSADIIVGGQSYGADDLDGNLGNDTYLHFKGEGQKRINDCAGTDTIYLLGYDNAQSISFKADYCKEAGIPYCAILCDGEPIILISENRSGTVKVMVGDNLKMTLRDFKWNLVKKTTRIACPVDVDILDPDGNVVLTLQNGAEETIYTDYGCFYVFSDENGESIKYFNMVDGYNFRIRGVDDGTMDVAYSQNEGEFLEVNDVPVTPHTTATVTEDETPMLAVDTDSDGRVDEVYLMSPISDTPIQLDQDYLALSIGDSVKLSVKADSEVLVDIIRWSAEDATGVGTPQAIVRVDADGTITAQRTGTAYVTASVTIDGVTYSDRCRVDVTAQTSSAAVQGVQLGTTALTTELFRTDYAKFDVILLLEQNQASVSDFSARETLEDQGVAVDSAQFEEEAVARLFDLVVKDDRTLVVVPGEEAVSNPGNVANSYTSKVTVTVGGETFTTDSALTLTVKKTMPVLKAEGLSFNSFYTNQKQSIVITGATVTGISRNEAKDTAKTTALPDWLTLAEGVLTLTEDAPAKSASGSVYVLAETEEWAVPMAVTVPVKLAYKAPALKLSSSSVTFAAADSRGVSLKLLCGSKTDTLTTLRVSEIQAPEGFQVRDFSRQDGSFTLVPSGTVLPGTGNLVVSFAGTEKTVALKLKISTKPVTLSVKPGTVTLNSVVGDSAVFGVTASPADYRMATPSLRLTDSKGAAVNELDLLYSDGTVTVKTNASTKPGAAYKLYISAGGSKEAAVTIKTLAEKNSKPTLSAKVEGAIDLTFPESCAVVRPSFCNYCSGLCTLESWSVTAMKGKTDLGDVTDSFEFGYWDGQYRLLAKGDLTAGNTYLLTMTFSLDDGSTYRCSVKVPVKRTAVKLKLSATNLSLNKSVEDMAYLGLQCLTKNYDLKAPLISAPENLFVSYRDGQLFVAVNEKTEYGATYRVSVRATQYDAPVTLTVKIPAENKSTVTATLKAAGQLDVIRDSTAITVTPTYKNVLRVPNTYWRMDIYSSADNYVTPVTDLFHVEKTDSGSFVITRAEGAQINPKLKYRAVLTSKFAEVTVVSAPVALKLTAGSAKITAQVSDSALYAADKNSRVDFRLVPADSGLNEILSVRIKNESDRNLFELFDYGSGNYAVGFRDGEVDKSLLFGKTSIRLPLEVTLDGNGTPGAATGVTLKLRYVPYSKTTGISLYAGVNDVTGKTLEMDTEGACLLTVKSQPANAPRQYVWSSSDEAVATVDPKTNVVYPHSPGKAVLTCTAADGSRVKAEVTILVTQAQIADLSIRQTYCLGETLNSQTLDLRAVFSGGYEKQILEGFTCTPSVLSEAGTQSVTVSYGGLEKTFEVEVLDFYELSAQVENISGEGYNEDGRVSWVLYVTGRYTGNYTAFSSRNDLPISTGRPVEFAEAWTDALNGQGGRWGYCCSDRGYGEYHGGCGFTLPDDPELAGRYQVSLSFGDVSKTASFTLVYEGDYTTGTGWSVSDVSWS